MFIPLLPWVLSLALGGPAPWVPPELGIKVGEARALSAAGRAATVIHTRAGFAAFWLEAGDAPHVACITGQRLGADGVPLGTPQRFACALGLVGPAAASDGERVALAWGTGGGVSAAICDGNLRPQAELYQAIGRHPASVALAHDGEAFVLAWTGQREVAALRFAADAKRVGEVAVLTKTRGESSRGRLACAVGRCAVFYQEFHGNSEAEIKGVALVAGRAAGGHGTQQGAFDVALGAGAGQMVVLTTNYARLLLSDLTAPRRNPAFDLEASPDRLEAPSVAVGEGGALVAFVQVPRSGWPSKTGITFVHPSATAVRVRPLLFEGGEPALATRDGRRFVLLTAQRGYGPVGLRVVDVEADVFAKAPDPRPPVATGVVTGADGGPASAAKVHYFARMAGGLVASGGVTAQPDGAFAIKHPHADDLSPAAVVTQLVLWAEREGEVSLPFINSSGPLQVTLRRVDDRQRARVRLSALDVHRQTRWGHPLNVLLAPGPPPAFGTVRLEPGRSVELDRVPPGKHAVLYFDDVGFHVGDEVDVAPAMLTTIEMPFVVALPAGMAGVVLNLADGRVVAQWVVPGSPAERAGVLMGDELVEIAGQPAIDVARTKQLLEGPPGAEVTLRVRRGRGTQDLTLRRSTGAPPPKVRVSTARIAPPPPDEQAARALITVHPGETLLEVVPTVHTLASPPQREQAAAEPFSVRAPEGLGVDDALRVIVHFDQDVFPPGIPMTLTLRGPGELHRVKEAMFHDTVMADIHCDPTVGGGPCDSKPFAMGVSGALGFEVGELDTPGVYELTVAAAGRGEVQRKIRVTGFEMGANFERHQHLSLAGYQMRARAVLRAEAIPGLRPATIQRVVYRDGKKTLEVDLLEVPGHHESLESYFQGATRGAKRMKLPLRYKEILMRQERGAFEASWPSGSLIVRVRGGSFGRNEEALVDHYFSVYESRW